MAQNDIYKASEAQTNASQREALAALARGGTAERDAYLAAQEAQKSDQGNVMREILARATAIGAPEGAANEMQAKLQPGFDRRSFALAGAQGSAATALGQISQANSNYFDQVNAAVPLVKARSDEINEANRVKAEREEADRQLQMQLKELALMQAQASLANTQQSGRNAAAKASGGGDLSDSELRTRLVGQARANEAAAPKQVKNLNVFGVKLPQLSETARARNVGVNAGLSPARVFGVVPPTKAKAAAKPPTPSQAAHRTDVTQRVQQHASPSTAKAFTDIVSLTSSYAQAISTLDATTDKELKEDYGTGISRDALKRWMQDYFT